MGPLAGFRYRQIVKRLKRLGLAFDRQAAGSHRSGSMRILAATPSSPTIPAICPKERSGRFSNKAGISAEEFLET